MHRFAFAALAAALVATPAVANSNTPDQGRLIAKARLAAGWNDVEVERIYPRGDVAVVEGHDRQGRQVTMTIDRNSGSTLERIVYKTGKSDGRLAAR